jgi:hypothetical protein
MPQHIHHFDTNVGWGSAGSFNENLEVRCACGDSLHIDMHGLSLSLLTYDKYPCRWEFMAGTGTLTCNNLTPAQYELLTSGAQQEGIPISGNNGTETKWSYQEGVFTFVVQHRKFFDPSIADILVKLSKVIFQLELKHPQF